MQRHDDDYPHCSCHAVGTVSPEPIVGVNRSLADLCDLADRTLADVELVGNEQPIRRARNRVNNARLCIQEIRRRVDARTGQKTP